MNLTTPPIAKIVIIGNSNVGKTCIVHRLITNRFIGGFHQTIGASTHEWIANLGDHEVPLKIWDTAGQEKFRSLVQVYFRDSAGAIIVYDATENDPLPDLTQWAREFRDAVGPGPTIIIAGNKIDDVEDHAAAENTAAKIAEALGSQCLLVSAKTGEGIDQIFETLASKLTHVEVEIKPHTKPDPIPEKKKCC